MKICRAPAFLLTTVVLTGCGSRSSQVSKPPAAVVSHPASEDQLNTVTLSEEAEGRLGLQTAKAEKRLLPRLRSYGGEITLPAGAVLLLSAPASGTLQAFKDNESPQVGVRVRRNQPLLALVPHALTQAERVALAQARLQLTQARIDAEGQLKQAQVQLEANKVTLARAQRLFSEQAGTKKDLDDAQALVQLAQKAFDAAVLRKAAADRVENDADSPEPLVIAAPRDGMVRSIFAAPGELVPSGTPLVEIMNADTVWIRVSAYVGELAELAPDEDAEVTNLADPPGTKVILAKPVQSPPTAQPHASAVDLYYQLANADGKYRPGQRVAVALRLKGDDQVLCMPWSAVVHDIHGGTWVYVEKAARTFVRQRVRVQYVTGGWAVLGPGATEGTTVVSAGAAELFGAEFGFGR